MHKYTNKNLLLTENIFYSQKNGFSTNEMIITVVIIGILATIVVPNFTPALEFIEILIAERHLTGAVKQCQTGIVNFEDNPKYSIPIDEINLGIFKKNKYILSHTGILGDCFPERGGNTLRISKISPNMDSASYSLEINVVTGNRSYVGEIPQWLDWWSGKFSPIIDENDTYFLN